MKRDSTCLELGKRAHQHSVEMTLTSHLILNPNQRRNPNSKTTKHRAHRAEMGVSCTAAWSQQLLFGNIPLLGSDPTLQVDHLSWMY